MANLFSSDEHRRKRPRSAVACDACKKRKSRCEPSLDSARCFRCAQLGSACSQELAESTRLPSAELLGEVARLRQRVAELERERVVSPSVQGHNAAETARSTGVSSSSKSPMVARVRDEAWFQAAGDPESHSMIQGGISTMAEHGLCDPVTSGMVTLKVADAAFQIFKHYIAASLPLDLFLSTRSTLPAHPFLRSACLAFASRCQPETLFTEHQTRELESNVCSNLLAYHRGCRSSFESTLACLVLSLLPFGQLSAAASIADFDPARMVGYAFGHVRELAHSAFLERMINILQNNVPTRHIAESLDHARLQMCVMLRVVWTNISRCPSNDLPFVLTESHERFLDLLNARGLQCDIDNHLSFELAALKIILVQAGAWQLVERLPAPSQLDIRQGNAATAIAVAKLDILRDKVLKEGARLVSLPWLTAHMAYMKWWGTVRSAWTTYRIPTPLLVGAVRDEWLIGVQAVAQASTAMINQCLTEEWDLTALPKGFGTAIVLCFHVISMGRVHFRHHYPHQEMPASLSEAEHLGQVESIIGQSGPALETMLRQAIISVGEYERNLSLSSLHVELAQHLPFEATEDGRKNASGYVSRADPGLIQWDALDGSMGWDWFLPQALGDNLWENL